MEPPDYSTAASAEDVSVLSAERDETGTTIPTLKSFVTGLTGERARAGYPDPSVFSDALKSVPQKPYSRRIRELC